MMDGSAPCSDLDLDVDVLQSNVHPPPESQQHDTSTKRIMEKEKSSDGSSLSTGLALTGTNGDATNLTILTCNATNDIVHDNAAAAAAAEAQDDGDDVVIDEEPAQQTIAINGETISISQNVDEICGNTNTSNTDISSSSRRFGILR